MLVLSRKTEQGIIIADSIRVVVLGVRGNRVKLGLEGPENVPIHREEIHPRIVEQNGVPRRAPEQEDNQVSINFPL
jgi:carbon storage regulator